MRVRTRALAATAVVAALAGCAAPAPAADDPDAITVAAAASLADAMTVIADGFERAHPGAVVRPIVSDGSSTLATQLRAGAPYDVFVSADAATMASVAELVAEPVPLATNRLVIVVPAGNPGGVTGLDDLASASTVLCAPEVPCGAASARLLALAGVEVPPVSLEQSVRAVLAKVEADAVDAGLVYATDAAASVAVERVAAEGAERVVTTSVAAAVRDSAEPELAAAFVAYAAGADARAVLDELGFGAP